MLIKTKYGEFTISIYGQSYSYVPYNPDIHNKPHYYILHSTSRSGQIRKYGRFHKVTLNGYYKKCFTQYFWIRKLEDLANIDEYNFPATLGKFFLKRNIGHVALYFNGNINLRVHKTPHRFKFSLSGSVKTKFNLPELNIESIEQKVQLTKIKML